LAIEFAEGELQHAGESMLKVSYFFDCTFLSFDTDASADPTSVVHFNLLPLKDMYVHQLVEDCNVDLKTLKLGFFKIAF
jgi:hypothetical protein